MKRAKITALLLVSAAFVGGAVPAHAGFFQQTNLVTDDSAFLASQGYTPTTQPDDPNLINPWGMSYGPGGPIWVSDNNSGFATVYSGAGVNFGLNVTIAPPMGSPAGTLAAPTGQVHNGTPGFLLSDGKPAVFLFATEDGTVSGWNPGAGGFGPTAHSELHVDNSAGGTGAVYKGLAIGSVGSNNFIYAANFRSGHVDVFDNSFGAAAGFSFIDPSPPPVPAGTPAGQGWAPFNIQQLNGHLYVTYALQNAAHHDDVAGKGFGFVDEFNLDGTFVRRVATGGALDSPWGLDIAPAGWGIFANDLLIGNFGNGEINVFNPNATDDLLGTLTDATGAPIVIGDLWGLINGNGGLGGDPNAVFFAAGVRDESHGLFGALTVPEPGSLTLLGAGLAGLAWLARRRSSVPPATA